MVGLLGAIGGALVTAFDMFWEVLWPLILGFALSGVVQAVVSHRAMARLLGDDSPRSLSLATLFGVASSSCSYVAVALARRSSAKARVSPPRWSSRSPRPISSSNSASS